MKKLLTTLTFPLLALAIHGTASAQIITQGRCDNAYNVSPETAQARYAWALHCKSYPTGGRSGALWLSDASVTDYNNTNDAYIKARLFPTYLNFTSFTVWDVSPDAYQNGNNCSVLPNGATNVGLCVAGCFPSDAYVAFDSGDVAIAQAHKEGRADLVTLTPEATLDDLHYMTNEVSTYTVDIVEGWKTIHTFTMKSGGSLRVTSEHPIVAANGKMRQAKTLEAGDALIREDGSHDPIVKVEVEEYFGKVYHLKPKTLDYASNVIVAQGYLNGSSRYQNEFLDLINRVIFRRALTDLPLSDAPKAK